MSDTPTPDRAPPTAYDTRPMDYNYDRDTPPARPSYAGRTDPGVELLSDHPTDMLRRMRNALRHAIPSDPTFLSALATAVGLLLDRELAHPARAERDAAPPPGSVAADVPAQDVDPQPANPLATQRVAPAAGSDAPGAFRPYSGD